MKQFHRIAVIILCFIVIFNSDCIFKASSTDIGPVLSSLELSTGNLNPFFSPDITDYSTVIGSEIASILITPSTNDTNASITVNNNTVISGHHIEIPLSTSETAINIIISKSGITTTYTVKAVRSQYRTTHLLGLCISSGQLSPAFNPEKTIYTANTGSSVSSIYINATVNDPAQTLTINGAQAVSGTPLNIDLHPGLNVITVIVTSPDSSQKSYTLTVNSALTVNTKAAGLSSLNLSNGTLSPDFNPDITSYNANVEAETDKLTVNATAQAGSAVIINGISGSSLTIAITNGSSSVTIIVTNGVSQETYTITITRAAQNAVLSALYISSGKLSPAFDPNVTGYSSNVEADIKKVTVTAASYPGYVVKINGSAGLTSDISLNEGVNTIAIFVTNGISQKTYTVTITRATQSTTLSALYVSSGKLSPAFDPNVYDYSSNVDANTEKVTVTVISQPGSAVKINGSSGLTSNISLNEGVNTIAILVTNGSAQKIYTITITRDTQTAVLSALYISSGKLSPVFDPNVTDYSAKVNTDTEKVTVTAAAQNGAEVKINGTSGYSSKVTLNNGINTVTILVTNGSANNIYIINITQEEPYAYSLYADSCYSPLITAIYSRLQFQSYPIAESLFMVSLYQLLPTETEGNL